MPTVLHHFIAKKVRPIELAALLKRLLFIKRKFRKINENYWYLDPISDFGLRLSKDRFYEKEFTSLILRNLKEGDTFVDLGTNEGYFSVLASKKVGQSGRVYSIEPQSRLHSIFSKNINKNKCYNVSLIPFAVSDQEREIEITLSPSINTGSSTFVKQSRRKWWKRETVLATTLDKLFMSKQIPEIDLIKIDIEGFELLALQGAKEMLQSKKIKKLLIEVHPEQLKNLGQSVGELEQLLNNHGYFKTDEGIFCYS